MTLPMIQEEGGALSNLLKGLSVGTQQAMPSIQEMIVNRAKQKQRQELLKGLSLDNLGQQDLLRLSAAGLDKEAAILSPFVLEKQKTGQKQQSEQSKTAEKEQYYGGILDELEAHKPYVGSTKIPFTKSWMAGEGGLNRPGVEKRAEIEPLAITLESLLRDMTSKGTLSKTIFERLMERIPKVEDSERVYQGKINAFRKIIKSAPKQEQQILNQALGIGNQKQSKGKKLSTSEAQRIFKEAGNDPEKARAKARELGYEF